MIVSGFLEVNDIAEVERVVVSLRELGVEVHGVKDERIVYLVERENQREIEKLLEVMKSIEGVKNLYLTYFTVDDEPKDDQNPIPSSQMSCGLILSILAQSLF